MNLGPFQIQFELIVGTIYLFLMSRSIHRKLNDIKRRLDQYNNDVVEREVGID